MCPDLCCNWTQNSELSWNISSVNNLLLLTVIGYRLVQALLKNVYLLFFIIISIIIIIIIRMRTQRHFYLIWRLLSFIMEVGKCFSCKDEFFYIFLSIYLLFCWLPCWLIPLILFKNWQETCSNAVNKTYSHPWLST